MFGESDIIAVIQHRAVVYMYMPGTAYDLQLTLLKIKYDLHLLRQ